MFIDTLEFTFPIDLCGLFSTLQQQGTNQMEFPASVNSYGTTQDASILVALRSNKITLKVDGVSSNASIISKSESKTLKLSVFDVDRSLLQQDETDTSVHEPQNFNQSRKRSYEDSVSLPAPKRKGSLENRPQSPPQRQARMKHTPYKPRPITQVSVNVKEEPEDPDLIEIEPDPETDVVTKTENDTPYMRIDYSSTSNIPHPQSNTDTNFSSSSFQENVPEYSEPGSSHGQGDQSAEDYLIYQDDDNSADYTNDVPLVRKKRKQSPSETQKAYRLRKIEQLGDEWKKKECERVRKYFKPVASLSLEDKVKRREKLKAYSRKYRKRKRV